MTDLVTALLEDDLGDAKEWFMRQPMDAETVLRAAGFEEELAGSGNWVRVYELGRAYGPVQAIRVSVLFDESTAPFYAWIEAWTPRLFRADGLVHDPMAFPALLDKLETLTTYPPEDLGMLQLSVKEAIHKPFLRP